MRAICGGRCSRSPRPLSAEAVRCEGCTLAAPRVLNLLRLSLSNSRLARLASRIHLISLRPFALQPRSGAQRAWRLAGS